MQNHECCYSNCPREGVVHIGLNGNPDSTWICLYHLDLWNSRRARYLADRRGCAMQELGEVLCWEETVRC